MQDVIWVKTKNKTKIENKKPLGVESLTWSSFKSGLILTSWYIFRASLKENTWLEIIHVRIIFTVFKLFLAETWEKTDPRILFCCSKIWLRFYLLEGGVQFIPYQDQTCTQKSPLCLQTAVLGPRRVHIRCQGLTRPWSIIYVHYSRI